MFTLAGCNVVITGATGFVGQHAAMELQRAGARVTALVRPTSNTERLRAMGVACKVAGLDDAAALVQALDRCGLVVHVAGAVGFESDWAPYYRANVEGTCNLLNAARRAGVPRFVHISSICAVGAAEAPVVLDETAPWNLGYLRVPYISTKRWAEEAARQANGPGLDVIILNPASVIGPADHSGSEFGVLCKRFWKGRIPFHFGGGNNFVDVRDVAVGIRLAAERGRPGQRYLLAGENRSYRAFFGDLSRAANRSIPRVPLPDAFAGIIAYLNDRLKREDAKRPYLSSVQVALVGLYFFFTASKAASQLGFHARPLAESLRDAHAFWIDARGAA